MTTQSSHIRTAFKWVIKEGDLYYPLINYRIDYGLGYVRAKPYDIGVLYSEPCNYNPRLAQCKNPWQIPGFHAWKDLRNANYERWTRYLENVNNKSLKITMLEIAFSSKDVIKEDNERIVVKRFVAKGEVHVENRCESEMVVH